MEKMDKQVKAHLFICCRQRDGKPCCSLKGAEDLVQELKTWTKNEGIKEDIKVSQSSCLGHCEKGITAVLYPQNKWFHEITPNHLNDLKNMLKDHAK